MSSNVLNIAQSYLLAAWDFRTEEFAKITSLAQGSNNGATPARVIMRKLVINASTKFATGVLSKEQKPLVIGKQVERGEKTSSQIQPNQIY